MIPSKTLLWAILVIMQITGFKFKCSYRTRSGAERDVSDFNCVHNLTCIVHSDTFEIHWLIRPHLKTMGYAVYLKSGTIPLEQNGKSIVQESETSIIMYVPYETRFNKTYQAKIYRKTTNSSGYVTEAECEADSALNVKSTEVLVDDKELITSDKAYKVEKTDSVTTSKNKQINIGDGGEEPDVYTFIGLGIAGLHVLGLSFIILLYLKRRRYNQNNLSSTKRETTPIRHFVDNSQVQQIFCTRNVNFYIWEDDAIYDHLSHGIKLREVAIDDTYSHMSSKHIFDDTTSNHLSHGIMSKDDAIDDTYSYMMSIGKMVISETRMSTPRGILGLRDNILHTKYTTGSEFSDTERNAAEGSNKTTEEISQENLHVTEATKSSHGKSEVFKNLNEKMSPA